MLINSGAAIDRIDSKGRKPLHYATGANCKNTVEVLIRAGADINEANTSGIAPLQLAVKNGFADVARLLIYAGANIETKTPSGQTLFQLANGVTDSTIKEEILSLLRNAQRTKSFSKAFYSALEAGDYAQAMQQARSAEKKRYSPNNCFISLIRGLNQNAQAKEADPETIQAILEQLLIRGLDINQAIAREMTPLHWIARLGTEAMVQTLLDRGADLEAKDARGRTALHYAAIFGNSATAQLLLKAGADPNSTSSLHERPMTLAAEKKHAPIMRLLAEAGADPNIRVTSFQTPLHVATEMGATDAVEALIKAGAFLNARDRTGNTPLQFAVTTGNEATAKALFAAHFPTSAEPSPTPEDDTRLAHNPHRLMPYPENSGAADADRMDETPNELETQVESARGRSADVNDATEESERAFKRHKGT